MEIILKRASDLIPYENNTKKHDQTQIDNVATSIQKFGWQQPIVIDKNNVVVIGHCRLLAAQQIALAYKPSAFDYAHDAMKTLFSLNLRISIASAVMYYIANMADIYIFNRIKQKTDGKALWLRNNISTILCNCLENFGFIGIAFAGIYDLQTIITIAVSTSIIELLIAICDTPFLYIAKRIKG